MMKKRYTKALLTKLGIFILLVGLTFTGCDTTSDSGKSGQVTLEFQTDTSTPEINKSLTNVNKQTEDTLTIEGSNGAKLEVTDIHLIVDDFELENDDIKCEDGTGQKTEDGCDEFEAEHLFTNLPLTDNPSVLDTYDVKPGTYNSLEFEVDDLDLDEKEDEEEGSHVKTLLEQIKEHNKFKKWPETASMAVSGKFTNPNGNETDFLTYADAEIEIEMELSTPLEIGSDAGHKSLAINISPAIWFKNADGTVKDLSKFDYSNTKKVIEFETEIETDIENGFESVEIERD